MMQRPAYPKDALEAFIAHDRQELRFPMDAKLRKDHYIELGKWVTLLYTQFPANDGANNAR